MLPFTKPITEVVPIIDDDYIMSLLNSYSSVLTEIVNFSSHILLWDIKKKREGKDNHIPTLFLRNMIDLIDGIAILTKSSSIDTAKLLVRSLFENNLYLTYMLQGDEKLLSRCFMVWRVKNQIKTMKQYVSSNQSSKEFFSKLKKDHIDVELGKYLDRKDTIEFLKTKADLLKRDDWKKVAIEYEKTAKRNRNPKWYSLYDGPRNIEGLSLHLRKSFHYNFIYRNLSQYSHVTRVVKGFAFSKHEKDKAHIIQIRDFESSKEVLEYTVSFFLETLVGYINKRLPEKSEARLEWYTKFKPAYEMVLSKSFNYLK